MPNAYGVYNEGTIVIEYWTGEMDFEEVLNHQIQQCKDLRIHKISSEIIDLRDAIGNLSDLEASSITNALNPDSPEKRMALIINRSDWALANQYSQSAWRKKVEVVTFYSVDAACAWLELDREHIEFKLKQLKKGLMVENCL